MSPLSLVTRPGIGTPPLPPMPGRCHVCFVNVSNNQS